MAAVLSPDELLQELLGNLWDAGDMGLSIKETTPLLGGFRHRDAERLIKAGRAEWIIEGVSLRAKY